jgi:hypothetical protein
MLQTGQNISAKQVQKKIQNMKNELKKKVDKKDTWFYLLLKDVHPSVFQFLLRILDH